MIQFESRYCIFHPKILSVSWSGHVHIQCPLGDKKLTVGLCRNCHKWETKYYANNGMCLYLEKGCKGCYGNKK